MTIYGHAWSAISRSAGSQLTMQYFLISQSINQSINQFKAHLYSAACRSEIEAHNGIHTG